MGLKHRIKNNNNSKTTKPSYAVEINCITEDKFPVFIREQNLTWLVWVIFGVSGATEVKMSVWYLGEDLML